MEEFEDWEDVVAGEFNKDDEFAYREDAGKVLMALIY